MITSPRSSLDGDLPGKLAAPKTSELNLRSFENESPIGQMQASTLGLVWKLHDNLEQLPGGC
jgi:hypothetical protein